jgi:hypothetical protein
MAPLPGSPALDAGDNTDVPAFDQRGLGFPRIVAGTIDIGAFEVQIGPASRLQVSAPDRVTANAAFDVTVTALDAYGHTAAGYFSTVGFSSSDMAPGVVLPSSYTFTAPDNAVHVFSGLVLRTPGVQTLNVVDTNGIRASTTIVVTAPVPPSAGSGTQGVGSHDLAAGLDSSLAWSETMILASRRRQLSTLTGQIMLAANNPQ